MLRSTLSLFVTGLFVNLAVAPIASAEIWSVETDCKEGNWTVGVELTGFGVVDASCTDGMENHVAVDVGELAVTGGSITAFSGTGCELPTGIGSQFTLECTSKIEDGSGFDQEKAVEIEVELEETEESER